MESAMQLTGDYGVLSGRKPRVTTTKYEISDNLKDFALAPDVIVLWPRDPLAGGSAPSCLVDAALAAVGLVDWIIGSHTTTGKLCDRVMSRKEPAARDNSMGKAQLAQIAYHA